MAAPILCGLDPPISGIFGDSRGETAQHRDRHRFPSNSRVQQAFIYFNYRPVSASFSGAYQVTKVIPVKIGTIQIIDSMNRQPTEPLSQWTWVQIPSAAG